MTPPREESETVLPESALLRVAQRGDEEIERLERELAAALAAKQEAEKARDEMMVYVEHDHAVMYGKLLAAERDNAALRADAEKVKNAERCPNCPDQGWYAVRDRYTGDPAQEQCEWCETMPNSLFNALRNFDAAPRQGKPNA
jgi:hypothetical protein